MAPENNEQALARQLQRWADGKATLKDVRGYSDEELYSVARLAYFFFYQGKVEEARTLFQGLYAVNPLDVYFAKALGVVEMAAGNPQGAMSAFDVALRIDPNDSGALVGRAEVKVVQGMRTEAVEDLRRARDLTETRDPLSAKISAMMAALQGR